MIRMGFRVLRVISRKLAAKLVARLFVKPRRHPLPERERAALARGVRSTARCGERDVAVWTFDALDVLEGQAAPRGTAILIHGWEGRGGQLGPWVEPLQRAGYRVVTFDHIGHGESDGVRCSLPRMRETLRCVAKAVLREGEEPAAVVAHSMGTFAATLLLAEGWRETRVVYLSPPDDLMVYFARYLQLVTGSDDLLPDVVRHMEERVGERADGFEFRNLVERLTQPLHVIHSLDDLDVPIEAGRFVAAHWPGATLREVDGLGHRRIVRDAEVVADGVAFLVSAQPAAPDPTSTITE